MECKGSVTENRKTQHGKTKDTYRGWKEVLNGL